MEIIRDSMVIIDLLFAGIHYSHCFISSNNNKNRLYITVDTPSIDRFSEKCIENERGEIIISERQWKENYDDQ